MQASFSLREKTEPLTEKTESLKEKSKLPGKKTELATAINESFELLRINYHHLYFSAYSEVDAVNSAKRLWLDSLSAFTGDTIRQATHELIKQSDYLPTISRMIKKCIELSTSSLLPDAYSAYVEACIATTPRQNHAWSHPAVYYAGQQSQWRILLSSDESIAYPIYKKHYEAICQALLQGETLPPITPLTLPESNATPLSKTENSKRMAVLREQLGI